MFVQNVRASIVILISFTVLLGVVYPAIITGVSKVIFPKQVEGSLIKDKSGKVIGSELIGQSFSQNKYFWGRLSATGPIPYNAAASSGSNLGVNSPNLDSAVKARVEALKNADPDNTKAIPVDLVTASGSGLDPHISLEAALYQLARVAKARGVHEEKIQELIAQYTENRQFGVLGEVRVNVLKLNLALDRRLSP